MDNTQEPIEEQKAENQEFTDNSCENNEEKKVTEEKKESTDDQKGKKFFMGKKGEKEEKYKIQITQLEKEKAELNDKFLRLYSEFDNYKKRTNKEKLDLISTASEKVIVNLLPIVDDFERAIAANKNIEEIKVIKDGFELIYNKVLQLLKSFEVEEIVAKGELFDTDYHEAITHFPAQDENDKGKVIDVTQKGYKIKEKVIRYSKVVVGD